jgi:hypothetical protein
VQAAGSSASTYQVLEQRLLGGQSAKQRSREERPAVGDVRRQAAWCVATCTGRMSSG